MSGLAFSTLISSSSGNCSIVSGPGGVLVIDAGFSSQKKFRTALNYIRENFGPVRAVIVTHAHRDHINYNSLKVLSAMNIPVFMSPDTIERVARSKKCSEPLSSCLIELYEDSHFRVSDMGVTSFPLEHSPGVLNHGFVFSGEGVRIGYATDLRNTRGLAPRMAGCDAIFLESNHDPAMLLENPNPNSHYHLANAKASDFIAGLIASDSAPRIVMYGHLSMERNKPALAHEEFSKRMNNRRNVPALQIAPPYRPSNIISLNKSNSLELFTPPESPLLDMSTR